MFKKSIAFFAISFSFSPSFAKELTINNLSEMIFSSTNQVKRVEDVLPLIPISLRTNYVLMTNSMSLQGATPELPRVIMFGQKADILIAFNGGDSAIRGSNTLEAIEYNAQTQSSEFVEYVFGAEPNTQFGQITRKNAYVSERRNPGICLSCHGNPDPRPNWNPYPVWPGASTESFRLTGSERQYLTEFIFKGLSHPRYGYLMRKENLSAMVDIPLETSMASKLDDALDNQREERLIKYLKSSPEFVKYRFALMGALSACEGIEGFLPSVITRKLESLLNLKWLAQDVPKSVLQRSPKHTLFFDGPENARIMTSLRWLLENRGVTMSHWSLSFESPYLFTTVPETFFSDIVLGIKDPATKVPVAAIKAMMLGPIAKLAVLTPRDVQIHGEFCAELRAKSLRQF